MSTHNVFNTEPGMVIIAYESYFITKLGMELGDTKWLRRNPVVFTSTVEEALKQYLKVFRRVSRLYLKGMGAEGVTVSFRRDSFRLVVTHPGVKIFYSTSPSSRPHLSNIRRAATVRSPLAEVLPHTITRNRHMSIYRYTYGRSLNKIHTSYNIPYSHLVTLSARPEFKFNPYYSLYKYLVFVGEFISALNIYYKAEIEAFNKDLDYIVGGSSEGKESITEEPTFNYRNVEDMSHVCEFISRAYPESEVERLVNQLHKASAI